MKKAILIVLFLLGLVVSGSAKAATVTMKEFAAFHHGQGGPWLATASGFGSIGVPSSFYTFCLEKNETFAWNTPYTATVNTGATQGGQIWDGSQLVPAGGFDPLSPQTAWLYTQYILGKSGYLLDNTAKATAFQEAIWALEGEINPGTQSTNSFYISAIASTWTDIGNVRVLNVGDNNQDVLTAVPAPAGLALLGLGSMGLAFIRRRKAVKA